MNSVILHVSLQSVEARGIPYCTPYSIGSLRMESSNNLSVTDPQEPQIYE